MCNFCMLWTHLLGYGATLNLAGTRWLRAALACKRAPSQGEQPDGITLLLQRLVRGEDSKITLKVPGERDSKKCYLEFNVEDIPGISPPTIKHQSPSFVWVLFSMLLPVIV